MAALAHLLPPEVKAPLSEYELALSGEQNDGGATGTVALVPDENR